MTTTVLRAMFAAAGVAAAGAMGMASASADGHQADLGNPVQLTDGATVQSWKVGGLQPSGDPLPYAPTGALWEATATNTSVAGGNMPFVPGFSARGGADSYPVLWGVASPQGVNPAGLAPGQSVTGKIYFDVTGAAPSSVVFGADGRDLAMWVTPPPPPAAPAGGAAPNYVPAAPSAPPAATAPAATAPAETAPAPAASGSQGTPLPATGSQGTPIPEGGSQGTPATSAATPPAAASTPTPANTPAPASSPATASTPAPASTPSAEASPTPTTGSSGTPLTAPTTTVVPAG